MTRTSRIAAVIGIVAAMAFAPTASGKPVFDCKDPDVRRQYPAQCPAIGPPGILGGSPGGTATGGSQDCSGLCGVVKGVLDTIGLGGIL
jgi:hypothetical protein